MVGGKYVLVPAARACGACFVMNMCGYLAGHVKRYGIKLGYRTVSIYVFKLALIAVTLNIYRILKDGTVSDFIYILSRASPFLRKDQLRW